MVILGVCLIMEKILKFKADNNNFYFHIQFFWVRISKTFDYIEPKVVPFKENVYTFSADYNAFGKPKVLNSHEYLMIKNNIENVWICKANLYCFIKF